MRTLAKKLGKEGIVSTIPKTIKNKDFADELLGSISSDRDVYDILVMDEAQDISDSELLLIGKILSSFTESRPSKSIYVFYDDFQNIFLHSNGVVGRLKASIGLSGQQVFQHFLYSCIRTSKNIIDLTFNACLGKRVDLHSKIKLEEAMGLDRLIDMELVTMSPATENQIWIDCGFCVFQGEAASEVRNFESIDSLFETLRGDIGKILDNWSGLNQDLKSMDLPYVHHSVLIQCVTKQTATNISNYLSKEFGAKFIRRRSGEDIWTNKKLSSLAVETGSINIALVQDAKGYDADVVFVINPDECGGSPYDKRAKFYVAATRAKQYLAIYNSLPEQSSPITQDALDAFLYMSNIGERGSMRH